MAWIGLGGGRSSRASPSSSSSGSEAGGGDGHIHVHGDDGDDGDAGDEEGSAAAAGWWSRYEHETISMADLALTLVSTCHPRDMPVFLARVQAIQKKRKQASLTMGCSCCLRATQKKRKAGKQWIVVAVWLTVLKF